ncbi:MAG: Txe/YoeB family addiction module toxin [Bacteroidales bacterium]|jgi:toxin YoeB|nr:Txe/YoeB family addiction module toxin [Bacteroidales bacterium]MDI9532793.1 Txe/YoeB family addiction module toxin [Bacteroidota bacterium]OQB55984.1 MAG: Toxin RelK [Bacteroidetes bacterium ADurb.Bin145]HUM34750.1 Txe/YoeB family addiction module toxin [Candidatus Saccharicenans sp.]MBK7733397.1 Txe/YoeB family addiction module toxin [Bacteroidales bacterium]
MKRITFSKNAWEDYLFWQAEDRKILKKINTLIKEIQSTLYSEIGKSEPLKYDLAGLWSRRIDHEHRLVYQVNENELLIYSCQYHYDL